MARDYKYRVNRSKKKPQVNKVTWWKWVLIILIVCLFSLFLVFLSGSAPEIKQIKSSSISKQIKKIEPTPKHQDKKPNDPQFVFYTELTKEESIIADHEINTRRREEQLGKRKESRYLIQAGSFRDASEADKLKARITLLGFHPRVEKANVKNTVWNRVKIGPFSHLSKVVSLKKRLRKNGIDIIVTEVKKQ